MTPEDIVAKFAHTLDKFEPIDGKPSDTDLTRLWEAVTPLLLQILHDEMGSVHSFISLIRPEATYVACYGEVFLELTRVGAYDSNIDNNATAVVHARSEAAHKAKSADHAAFETARGETTKFVLAVVADTWVRELWDSDSLYTEVAPKELFSHLQAGCTSRNALDFLELHNKMQRYHLKVKGIPEYIDMLEDAQRQAGRAGRTIGDETLLLFVSTAMLTSKRFPRANDDWVERAEREKTWYQWKIAYKRARAKARVKAQAKDSSVKFGEANFSARHETANPPLENQLEEDGGGLKTLEGYFNKLAAVAVNEKGVLQQLMLNNTNLSTSNESLVALVKKLSGDIKNLEREISRMKKGGQVSARNTTLCEKCKKEVFHQPHD